MNAALFGDGEQRPVMFTRSAVVDQGCGTGSLSVLGAEAGYAVHGNDLSLRMVEVARDKAAAAGVMATFEHGASTMALRTGWLRSNAE